MAIERTLSIIKPDGVEKNIIGEIFRRFEAAGLRVVAARMMHLDQAQAGAFYAVHKERPFYGDLVEFMCSGPVVPMVLEGEGAGRHESAVLPEAVTHHHVGPDAVGIHY